MSFNFNTLFAVSIFSILSFAVLSVPKPTTQANEVQKKVEREAQTSAKGQPKLQKLDLGAAVEVTLPSAPASLKAASFRTPDGRSGWVLRLPEGRPIATPAYDDGMLFVGGGYGSHEFYAIDAETGRIIWKIQTGDDGPTAAVVSDGYVAFNTESCTLIVVDEKTGKIVWQEWLGDPLMSQPAIDEGVLYMAYPGGQRESSQKERRNKFHPRPATPGGGHRFLALDLETGRHIWQQQIAADVITAPVISDGTVYFTTFDGTSYALNAEDGEVVWVKKDASTSAPVIYENQVIQTKKEKRGSEDYEGIMRKDAKQGKEQDAQVIAGNKAEYLKKDSGGGVALSASKAAELDSSVGFGAAPQAAQLSAANESVGVSSVVGGWAYQGSRAAVNNGQIMNAQGRYLNAVRAKDGKENWRAEIVGPKVSANEQIFSPPAVGAEYLYLTGAAGHLISVRQSDGSVGFSYALKAPMTFQPALAKGNIYAGTADGRIICLKTGNKDADGWYAWGGNAQHNKVK
ncbi:MAG TPA: PQQ-binding-like beta-propeller repeat protein [Candidatus Eremiobacteraceae bacterium]|nr:PQQ-binding-like beta-propeller repeat protein [Candidatus Eremiobacteraceae bacterium]